MPPKHWLARHVRVQLAPHKGRYVALRAFSLPAAFGRIVGHSYEDRSLYSSLRVARDPTATSISSNPAHALYRSGPPFKMSHPSVVSDAILTAEQYAAFRCPKLSEEPDPPSLA